jgi:4-diphosphocytidyl-2-C-methyl-D-erythritol kinase
MDTSRRRHLVDHGRATDVVGRNPSPGNSISLPAGDAEGEIRTPERWPLVSGMVRVRVPAKVNLHLRVGARRPDGFHDLLTVYLAVDLFDELVAVAADDFAMSIEGEGAGSLPAGTKNLAWQAASLLATHAGVPPAARLTIRKGIPVAGGLAGGSADAAAALVACAELWRTGTSRPDLAAIAAELGSDVPFALTGGCAVGTGRGERLSPAMTSGEFHFVLAFADHGIATPDAYRALDRMRGDIAPTLDPNGSRAVLDALRRNDVRKLAAALVNDLQKPALSLSPRLRRTLSAGRELGALAAMVSGSGPTCLFLVDSAAAAARLASALAAEGVCRSTRVVKGPVPGARLVR